VNPCLQRVALSRDYLGVDERAHHVFVDILHDGAQLLVACFAHKRKTDGRTQNISTCTLHPTTVNSTVLGS
jgi:hypothetical protein